MPASERSFLYCFDDHRSFSGEIRERFSDPEKYNVSVSHNTEDFIMSIKKEKDSGFCKIALIGVQDKGENHDSLNSLLETIRKINGSIKVILLCVPDRMEAIKKNVSYSPDACIPVNSNLSLRIHNIVKRIISEHNLLIFRKRRNRSLYILLAFALAAVSFLIFASIHFSQYF